MPSFSRSRRERRIHAGLANWRQNTALKDLLALSRRIKELWVFGPLASHDASTRRQADSLERDVLQVAALINSLEEGAMSSLAEGFGGEWKERPKEAPAGRG